MLGAQHKLRDPAVWSQEKVWLDGSQDSSYNHVMSAELLGTMTSSLSPQFKENHTAQH